MSGNTIVAGRLPGMSRHEISRIVQDCHAAPNLRLRHWLQRRWNSRRGTEGVTPRRGPRCPTLTLVKDDPT